MCVVCGRFAEYVVSETEDDICSVSCKKVFQSLQAKLILARARSNQKAPVRSLLVKQFNLPPPLSALCWSPAVDQRLLLVISSQTTLCMWDSTRNDDFTQPDQSHSLDSALVALSTHATNVNLIYVAQQRNLLQFSSLPETRTYELTRTLRSPTTTITSRWPAWSPQREDFSFNCIEANTCVALATICPLVFVGMMSGSIAVYDVTSGELVQILEGHADTVLSLTLNADNTLLVSTSTDRTAGYWQLPTLQRASLKLRCKANALCCSPATAMSFLGLDDGAVLMVDNNRVREIRHLHKQHRKITSMNMMRKGHWFISAGADAKGGNAVLWDAAKLLPMLSMTLDQSLLVQFCDISLDSKEVVLADEQGHVQIYGLKLPHEVS